jgi:peptidoglycan hydrolase-like protein with peptidoglycan-binding domain
LVGWYPYSAWGEYPYGNYAEGSGEPPGAQDEASAIQSRLANLGFYHGPIDGKVGSGTESALKAFQAQHGLRASGQIDDDTLNALGLGQGQ